jgi:hypothetical protein
MKSSCSLGTTSTFLWRQHVHRTIYNPDIDTCPWIVNGLGFSNVSSEIIPVIQSILAHIIDFTVFLSLEGRCLLDTSQINIP